MIQRPRLTARLDALLDPGGVSVVLVCAAPGFGKTSLIRCWADGLGPDGPPVAFCSLAAAGAGSGTMSLWRAVVRAIALADAELAPELERLGVPDRAGQEGFLVDLLDVLASRELVLVLDDVHVVRSRSVMAELDQLCRRLPASLRLVLASRSQPALPVAHDLRLAGRLDQIGAHELAFSPAEAASVCSDLTTTDQQRVWERTEGWPAMVRLMHLAVVDGMADDDLWDHEDALVDHVFTEVFGHQAPDAQRVMMMASVPDPAPLDLVVGLTGRADAGRILDTTIRRSGLATPVRLDGGGAAYHLHPILRAYLHGELLRQDHPAEREAQKHAARWFRNHAHPIPAMRHALLSEDDDEVECALSTVGLSLVNDGFAERLLALLDDRAHRGVGGPWRAVVHAAALLDAGRTAEAATHLVGPGDPVDDPGLELARRGVESHLRRRQAACRSLSPHELVADWEAGVSRDACLIWSLHLGAEACRTGALEAAERLLSGAADLAEGLGRGAALTDAASMLAGVSAARSDCHALRERAARALAIADEHGWGGSSRACYPHMLAGWGARQELRDAEGRHHALRASELLDPDAEPGTVFAVQSLQAAVDFQGDHGVADDAARVHQVLRGRAGAHLPPDHLVYMALADARFSLARGRSDRLDEILAVLHDHLGESAEARLVEAMGLITRGQRSQALAALHDVIDGVVAPVVPLCVVDGLALASRLCLEADDHYRAVDYLRRALDLSAGFGSVRALVDGGGAAVVGLLRDDQGSWAPHEQLVTDLLQRVSTPSGPAVALTSRERDVLRELPTLRTVDEIAGSMVVSVNTVKTHLRSVYRKLGVSTRREAVAEARRSGLV